MDADTQTALDLMADEAMREYAALPVTDRAYRRVLCDGLSRIREVVDSACYPCVGYVWTDLGEKLPMFDVFTREQAKSFIGRRVKLALRMSERGTRYVIGMMALPVDTSTDVWACAQCGSVARLRTHGDGAGRYCCTSCAYQMEVGA